MSLRTTALRTGGLVCTVLLAFSLAGCPDDPDMPDAPGSDAGDAGRDGGTPGDGGMCTGTPCTTAGVTCEGNSLVTCALVAGCLVETAVNCTLDDQICDDSGATPACVDACADIPVADRCTTVDARMCTGETLEVCTMNTEGCLVLERTACDAAAGGLCDETATVPVCVAPADPCAGIADACTTAGTSCDTDSLVTCAPNAFGCLVETTVDCTTATAGACDASGTTAVCTTTDVCPTACTAGTSCSGPNLVTCAADAFGCLVETTADCTTAAFGFCDAAATPAAMCSTAATDPCLGVTECGTAPARTCTADTLSVCSANAFGCFVAVDTDCTTDGNICDPTEPASCVAPSVCGDGVIEGSETCDDTNVVAGDGCSDVCVLEAGWVCTGSPTVCVATCAPLAAARVLNCASGTVNGDTADGTDVIANYCGSTLVYPNNEEFWRFSNETTGSVEVRVVATRGTSTRDADLFVLEADDTAACADTACADSSTGTTGIETVDFAASAGEAFFVGYDIWNTPDGATTDYTLTVTCTPLVCGDGIKASTEACDDGDTDNGDGCSSTCTIEPLFACTGTTPTVCTATCPNGTLQTSAGETCDDNNSTNGDGCSATCAIEAGYVCTGAPSTCVMPPANAFCAGAIAVAADATFTGLDPTLGGPRTASGTACSGSTSSAGYFYAVTVPVGQRVLVTETGTIDSVLNVMADCAATVCVAGTDTPENLTINNVTGTAPLTRIVGVHRYASFSSGTMGVSFAYTTVVCGDGVRVAGAEACDDGDTDAGDGCSATCTVEPNFTCNTASPTVCVPSPYITSSITLGCVDMTAGTAVTLSSDDDGTSTRAALPFAFTSFGAAMSHYQISSNGFMGLFPADSGTITSSFGNPSTVPSTTAPNGYVAPFWDDLYDINVRILASGTAPNQVFTVEWDGLTFSDDSAVRVQAQLSQSGVLEYHYCAGSGTNSNGVGATIATENAAGTAGVAFSINTASITPGTTAVRFTPNP